MSDTPPPFVPKPPEEVPVVGVSRQAGDRRELPLPGGVAMAFRWCPPGVFTMGSPESEEGRRADENQVPVTLSRGFWMAETPVTQGQYFAVTGSYPSGFGSERGENWFRLFPPSEPPVPRTELPVEKVSWDDAVAFCRRVSAALAVAITLPTEAQWEYACRAGTTTPFFFGATITTEQANYNGDLRSGEVPMETVRWRGLVWRRRVNPQGSDEAPKGTFRRRTTPVGRFPANAWGLSDMHGNVWEWCADWHGDKLLGGTDPTGPSAGSRRVIRGGAWLFDAKWCRSASRSEGDSTNRNFITGFRVVLLEG